MKPHLPYNILLALTIAVTGAVVLYNAAFRESYASTLRYSYPAIEQPEVSAPPAPEQIEPEPETEWIEELGEEDARENAVTSVQFPLDINTATYEQLLFIPRVGDVTAQRILQYREQIGGYSNLTQLMEIKGIGQKTYERLYAYFVIEGEDEPEGREEPPEESGQEDPEDPPEAE